MNWLRYPFLEAAPFLHIIVPITIDISRGIIAANEN